MSKYSRFIAGITGELTRRRNGDSFRPILLAVWQAYYRRHDVPQCLRNETEYDIDQRYSVLAELVYQNMVDNGKIEDIETIFKNIPPLEYPRLTGEVFSNVVADTLNLQLAN